MSREILADGSPLYLKWAEEYFIGGCLLASAADVAEVSLAVEPEDFRDDTLGKVWEAVRTGDNALSSVCATLHEWGQLDEVGAEPRLATLASSQGAMLYAGLPSLKAHAHVIKDWSNRRRLIQEASEVAQAVYAGAPVSRGVKVRGLKRVTA